MIWKIQVKCALGEAMNSRKQRLRLALCLLLLLGLAEIVDSTALAQTYIFGRADFATGAAPVVVLTGDFNGDGKLDLAVINRADSTVSVLLGKPDGTFAPKVDYAVSNSPQSGAVGDFNKDGKLDLVVGSSVLLGNGDGTFQPTLSTGSSGLSVIAADFNGDGKLDLAIAGGSGNTVSVLLGNADGTFQAPADYSTGLNPTAVVTGDFNGDGKLDLAVANKNDNTISILLGNGDGTFRSQTTFAAGASPTSLSVGDFNGDGKLDLAVASLPLSVLIGNGDGTFQAPVSYLTSGIPTMVTSSDLNGDGKADLAVATFAGGFSILIGNGDGTFKTSVDYGGASPAWVAIGDLNGDGKLDLAVANFASNSVSIFLGGGDGTFILRKDYSTAGPSPISVAIADFNSDGNPDLAVPNSNPNANAGPGTVSILLGKGDGTFHPHVDYVTGADPLSLGTGDFNGNGKPDLAVLNFQDNTVSILVGNGDGTFHTRVDFPVGSLPRTIATGDFNRDGRLDLAVAHGNFLTSFGISVLLGNGDGTFQSPVEYATPGPPLSIKVADFNNDGNLDLVIINFSLDTVSVLLGNGEGTFQKSVTYPTGGISAQALAVGDFNKDGKLDLAVVGAFGGTVLLGNGDGTFRLPPNFFNASGFTLAVGDFDGDGKLDLVVPGSILFGNGDGTFRKEAGPDAGAAFAGSLQTADVDRDGSTDIVAANQTGTVSVFLNRPFIALFPTMVSFAKQLVGTTSTAQTAVLYNPSSPPLKITSIVASGDFTQTNTCGSDVPGGANCTVSITFAPTASGTRTGRLTITDNSPGSPQVIGLTGTGTGLAFIEVAIDIKPGDSTNTINPGSKGKIPVAVLSSRTFDAVARIDQTSLTFGRTGDESSLAFCNTEDVNRDGLLDLVCNFNTQNTGFVSGDTVGILKGKTVDGIPVRGTDSVRIVPE
jgi:hypothetical protein